MGKKYHFLTASTRKYADNSFKELLKEEKEYKGFVYWHIGNHKINVGDKCYIYYSNLPDDSSRILFVGDVIDSDLANTGKKSICPDPDKNQKYVKLKLKSVSLEDKEKYNLDKLRNKYNLLSNGQFSYLHIDEKKHKKLIKDIENESDNYHHLKYVYEYFENNYCICEFGCKTFVEENGFHYVERHHLVERNLINKHKNIDSLINDKNNIFNLCPMCHKKIHHARKDVRREMIDFLYNKNKKFFDDSFNEIKTNKNTLNWLYELYNCNK